MFASVFIIAYVFIYRMRKYDKFRFVQLLMQSVS